MNNPSEFRMADFAKLYAGIGRAIGLDDAECSSALRNHYHQSAKEYAEGNDFVTATMVVLEQCASSAANHGTMPPIRSWANGRCSITTPGGTTLVGFTPQALLDSIRRSSPALIESNWLPTSPQKLKSELDLKRPVFAALGINVFQKQTGHARGTVWIFEWKRSA